MSGVRTRPLAEGQGGSEGSIPTTIPVLEEEQPSLADALKTRLKAAPGGAQDGAEGGLLTLPSDNLAKNQARLPNGDVVTMKEESWGDTVRVSSFLRRIGCDTFELGQDGYTIAKIIMAIEKVGEGEFMRPKNKSELLFVADQIKGPIRSVLMNLYSRLNAGQEDAGAATFVADPAWQRDIDELAANPALEEALVMATLWGTNGLDMAYLRELPHRERIAHMQVLVKILEQKRQAQDVEVRRIQAGHR